MTLLGSICKGSIKGAGYGALTAGSFAALSFFAADSYLERADELCGSHNAFPEMKCMSGPGPALFFYGMFLKSAPIVLAPFIIAVGATLGGAIAAVTDCLSEQKDEIEQSLQFN